MRIAVTGAAGRIIGYVVRELRPDHEVIGFFAADSLATEPLCDLVPRFYPGAEAMAAGLTGTQPGISIDKARRLLGYEPRHSWRDQSGR